MARFFVAGLLACLLVNSVFAYPEPETLKYKVKATKSLRLEPCTWNLTNVVVDALVYIKPSKEHKNALSITISNPSIVIERDHREPINLGKCSSAVTAGTWLTKPFLASFNENGVLESITVGRKEPELSRNVKLLGTSLLQLDIPQLTGLTEHSSERKEPTSAGICPTVNEIVAHNEHGIVRVKKIIDYLKCDEVVDDCRSDGLTCLSNCCRSGNKKKNLQWTGGIESLVKEIDGEIIIEKLVAEEEVSYNPYEKSETSAVADTRVEAELVSIGRYSEIPSYRPSLNEETICKPSFRKVNKDICETPKSKWNLDLKESYNALVCEQPYSTLFEDIIERAILCNHRG